MTKEEIRRRIKERRLLLEDSQVKKLSRVIEEKLYEILKSKDNILFYYPFKKEVNLLGLAEKLIKEGKTVAFPKVVGKEIVPIVTENISTFSPGKFNIPEPPYEPAKVLKNLEVVLVPGIAFDLECFRVGYGGGFYDRFLAKGEIQTKIGICFDFQLVERLPREPFDVPVDLVITEKREIRRKEWS